MAKYNLKHLVKIVKFDFYKVNDYQYTKVSTQPIRNLFRKKENRKYVEGWVHYFDHEGEIIPENEIPH